VFWAGKELTDIVKALTHASAIKETRNLDPMFSSREIGLVCKPSVSFKQAHSSFANNAEMPDGARVAKNLHQRLSRN